MRATESTTRCAQQKRTTLNGNHRVDQSIEISRAANCRRCGPALRNSCACCLVRHADKAVRACLKVHRQCGNRSDSRDKAYSLLGWGDSWGEVFLFGAKIHFFIHTDHILSVLWNAQHRLYWHRAVHQADAGVGGVAVYAGVFQ